MEYSVHLGKRRSLQNYLGVNQEPEGGLTFCVLLYLELSKTSLSSLLRPKPRKNSETQF